MKVNGTRIAKLCLWIVSLLLIVFAEWKFWDLSRTLPPSHDESVYTYVGWSWREGYWPYRDSWDHKGPMVYVATLIRATIVGTAPEFLVVQEIIVNSTTAVLVSGLAYLLWGEISAALALVVCTFLWTQAGPSDFLATPGSLIGMFTTAAILAASLAVRAMGWRSLAVLAGTSGLISGLALSTKPNAITPLLIAALVILWFAQYVPTRNRLILVIVCLLGAVIPIVVFAGLFYFAGALDAFVDCYFVFNSIYGRLMLIGTGVPGLLVRARESLANLGLFRLCYIVGLSWVAAVLIFLYTRGRATGVFLIHEVIIPLWLVLELVLFASNGAWGYHAFPLIPVLSLGSMWLVAVVARFASRTERRWSIVGKATLLVTLSLLVILPLSRIVGLKPEQNSVWPTSDWKRMVSAMAEATATQGKVFNLTWDSVSIMNYTHRRSVSRYVHIAPIIARGYTSDARWAEYLSSLQDNAPNVILISNPDSGTPQDLHSLVDRQLDAFYRASVILNDDTDFPHREEFEEFIASHYRLEECASNTCMLRQM